MMTVEALKAFGADTEEALRRCFNNEAFYLRLVGMGLADANFDKLKSAVEVGDNQAVFEAAHALKGSIGNVALTPIYEPICALTELLRGSDKWVDGGEALFRQIMDGREKALAL